MPGAKGGRGEAVGRTDADAGLYRGRAVARVFRSPDGLTVLVGRSARDNDELTLRLASPRDFWLHVASGAGSHVVVRNPEGLDRLPRETARFAAGLAVTYSQARGGGRTAVHLARRVDVSKPRGAPAGQVSLRRFTTIRAAPLSRPEPGSPQRGRQRSMEGGSRRGGRGR